MTIKTNMKSRFINPVSQHASAIAVLLVCCFLTIVAFVSEQRHMHERMSTHASADATQSQRVLQQGIDSYIHVNRDLAAHFTAAERTRASSFGVYMQAADVMRQHPGLSYIGYIERVARGGSQRPDGAAAFAGRDIKGRQGGPDPAFIYPYLYAYPLDARSRGARGLDFSVIPERWTAMQQARDSGQSTATSKHVYITGPARVPVIVVFTPIYDAMLPSGTLAERRIALRGFVFSIYEVDAMIERVMGSEFRALFDLEIYDGAVRSDKILYDGDKLPHVLLQDDHTPIARRASVTLAGREWQLFFYPKPAYLTRYHSWYGLSILVIGFFVSGVLSWLMWRWTQRLLAGAGAGALQFDAVFEHHPSAVYSLDLNGRIVNVNAHALKEFLIPRADLIGTPAEHLVSPDGRAIARARFEETLRGNAISYESTIIDGTGARIELSVIMIPIKTGSEVTSVLGIAKNVTAQKLAEWRLQDSRNMLQLVINNLPQRVFWKDTNFTYLGCNEAAARDAGLNHPDEIVGRTDFELAWRSSAHLYRADDIENLRSGVAKKNYEEPQDRGDGSVNWLRTSKIPLTDMGGNTIALLGMYEDITDRKEMETKLRELAHYDSLTGLANRAFFYNHLELAVAKSQRQGGLMALMYFDIDGFKNINDSLGHAIGDALLRAFARRVNETVREMDVFARIGGDEFALLLENLPNRAAAERVAAKLVEAMQAPFQLKECSVMVTSSIGVALLQNGMSPDHLVQRADNAMYEAKRGGRNRFEVDRAISCA